MTNEEKETFYTRCGEILGIEHDWNTPVPRRTRWNNRRIGNGRFPGFGIIRVFGNQIMVMSRTGTQMFDSAEEVYQFIEKG